MKPITHRAHSIKHALYPVTPKRPSDCRNGYHSIPLHTDDRHLTTFITPWGRYHYKTAPQGSIASGDGYSRRFDKIVCHVPDKTKSIDNTLLWAYDLNKRSTSVDAIGLYLTQTSSCSGLTPSNLQDLRSPPAMYGHAKRTSMLNPTPASITDLCSWFGLINHVLYAFAATVHVLLFRQLLQQETPFKWTDKLNQLFEESKSVIISEIEKGVRIFDKSKPTCLATNWSKSGIGFWLFQKHCQCSSTESFCCRTGQKITLVGSRFTHAAESCYAPVEGEALAMADTLDEA